MSGAFRYIPVLLFIRYNQYNTEFGIILASSAPLYKNVSAPADRLRARGDFTITLFPE